MRIDVHAHYWTEDYLDLLADAAEDRGNPFRLLPVRQPLDKILAAQRSPIQEP